MDLVEPFTTTDSTRPRPDGQWPELDYNVISCFGLVVPSGALASVAAHSAAHPAISVALLITPVLIKAGDVYAIYKRPMTIAKAATTSHARVVFNAALPSAQLWARARDYWRTNKQYQP